VSIVLATAGTVVVEPVAEKRSALFRGGYVFVGGSFFVGFGGSSPARADSR